MSGEKLVGTVEDRGRSASVWKRVWGKPGWMPWLGPLGPREPFPMLRGMIFMLLLAVVVVVLVHA